MSSKTITPDGLLYTQYRNPFELLKKDILSFLTEYVKNQRIKSFRKPETLAAQVNSLVTYTITLYSDIEIEIIFSFLERYSESDFAEYFVGNRINVMINKDRVSKKKIYAKIREYLATKNDMGLETAALKASQEYIIHNLGGRLKKVSEVQLDSYPYFGGLLFKWERDCGKREEFIIDIRPTSIVHVSACEMNYKRKEKRGREFLVPIEMVDLIKKPSVFMKRIKRLAINEFR